MTSPDAPDLNAIEARANAATKGPWFLDSNGADHAYVGNRADGREYGLWEIVYMTADKIGDLKPEAAERELTDAEFIAHARTDVPTLIAALREAQADATQGWDTYRRCQIELDGLVREVVAAETKLAAIQDAVDLAGAHRFDLDPSGSEQELVDRLARLGEKRKGGPDNFYNGVQFVVGRLRDILNGKGEPT